MRIRKANEAAINKTLNFLNALQHKCDGTDFTEYTTSQLHIAFQVSKSTYSVCKKLSIVKETPIGIEWIKEQPNWEMCLQILGVLLEQKKKEVVMPISTEWLNLSEVLTDISEKLTIGINQQKSVLNRPILPLKESSLFSDQEQRQKDEVYIAGQIASGIYFDHNQETIREPVDIWNDDHIEKVNNRIIFATKDLLNKLRNK